LPWDAIKELLAYVLRTHYKGNELSLEESVKSKYSAGQVFPADWKDADTALTRKAIGLAAWKKEWFKRIDHGETLGKTIFKYFGAMAEGLQLKKMFTELSNWIDN
jgi:putative ATP-dependent endonuclease of OLD family